MTQTLGYGNTHTSLGYPLALGFPSQEHGGKIHSFSTSRPSPAPTVEHASFSRPEIWRSQRGVGKGGSAQLPIHVSISIGIAILSSRPGHAVSQGVDALKHHAGAFLEAPVYRHSTRPQCLPGEPTQVCRLPFAWGRSHKLDGLISRQLRPFRPLAELRQSHFLL